MRFFKRILRRMQQSTWRAKLKAGTFSARPTCQPAGPTAPQTPGTLSEPDGDSPPSDTNPTSITNRHLAAPVAPPSPTIITYPEPDASVEGSSDNGSYYQHNTNSSFRSIISQRPMPEMAVTPTPPPLSPSHSASTASVDSESLPTPQNDQLPLPIPSNEEPGWAYDSDSDQDPPSLDLSPPPTPVNDDPSSPGARVESFIAPHNSLGLSNSPPSPDLSQPGPSNATNTHFRPDDDTSYPPSGSPLHNDSLGAPKIQIASLPPVGPGGIRAQFSMVKRTINFEVVVDQGDGDLDEIAADAYSTVMCGVQHLSTFREATIRLVNLPNSQLEHVQHEMWEVRQTQAPPGELVSLDWAGGPASLFNRVWELYSSRFTQLRNLELDLNKEHPMDVAKLIQLLSHAPSLTNLDVSILEDSTTNAPQGQPPSSQLETLNIGCHSPGTGQAVLKLLAAFRFGDLRKLELELLTEDSASGFSVAAWPILSTFQSLSYDHNRHMQIACPSSASKQAILQAIEPELEGQSQQQISQSNSRWVAHSGILLFTFTT